MTIGQLIVRLQGEIARKEWDAARRTSFILALKCREQQIDYIERRDSLVSSAARAVETFDEDELEAYAYELEEKRRRLTCPRSDRGM